MLMPGLAAEGESIQIGGDAAYELFAMREFYELDEHSLFLTMYRAVGFVCGLKEAMWEELATLSNLIRSTTKTYATTVMVDCREVTRQYEVSNMPEERAIAMTNALH